MAGEIKNTPMERLVDLENLVARMARRVDTRTKTPQQIDPLRCRMARTQGDTPGDPNDASYPAQVDGKGARLPIVFLDLVYDVAAADTVVLTPRSATPQAWLYSPFGWIPRLIDLRIHEQGGLWVASYVPELEVEFMDNVSAGASGTVKIVRHGAANNQTFECWFDHMVGSNSALIGDESAVNLREGRKLWATGEKEC